MSDLTHNLKSLSFEKGLSESEIGHIPLRAHSAALTVCGCAHAIFLLQLHHSIRCSIQSHCAHKSRLLSRELRVGIVGMGHLGKQLLLSILNKTPITESEIKVSTRRPEYAEDVAPGVECFFDNVRLAQWADVLFLCCLPSHLPSVCADLSSHLCTHTIVYCFSSAVPISRLIQLLGHNFVLKSQYDTSACDSPNIWMTCTHLCTSRVLNEPFFIKSSSPLSPNRRYSHSLSLTWVCAVLNSLVNICTAAQLGCKETLYVINHLFKGKLCLDAQDVYSTSSLSANQSFPWIPANEANIRKTPLYSILLNSKSTQDCISALFTALLEPTPQAD
ncbi:hypothetical protein WMY93_016504 [Mugilogobius chulae]|uniref:NADP-dependent oxidoreductase domain-containing protein 1 n=1 Tax=Mugilogobius chulae TaxID=88201 RepID=A0AAW0NVT4_9GOBI